MENQGSKLFTKNIKGLILIIGSLSLTACGDGGFLSDAKSFTSKQVGPIQMNEGDEQALGLDTVDIESGEEVTAEDEIAGLGDGSSDPDGEGGADADDGYADGDGADGEDGADADDEYADGNDGDSYNDLDANIKCNGNGKCDRAKNPTLNGGNGSDNRGGAKKNGAGNYICILEGSGKSIRLGLIDNTPAGQTGTPSVICMSQQACLSEVSKAFDVKMAHKRGFCPNKNPHVVDMSDDEVAAMIDAL